MNRQFVMLTSVLATGLACAQNAPPTGPVLDESSVFQIADANHDGKVTRAEWEAAGLPASVFSLADRKNSGSISLSELNSAPFPSDMDANRDGVISAEEMKKYVAAREAVPEKKSLSRSLAPTVTPSRNSGLPPSEVPGSTPPGTVPGGATPPTNNVP